MSVRLDPLKSHIRQTIKKSYLSHMIPPKPNSLASFTPLNQPLEGIILYQSSCSFLNSQFMGYIYMVCGIPHVQSNLCKFRIIGMYINACIERNTYMHHISVSINIRIIVCRLYDRKSYI